MALRGFRPKPRSGISGLTPCRDCVMGSREDFAVDGCPRAHLLTEAFMNQWMLSAQYMREYPQHDERRSLSTMLTIYERLGSWGKRVGCAGRELYEEALQEYTRSLPKER